MSSAGRVGAGLLSLLVVLCVPAPALARGTIRPPGRIAYATGGVSGEDEVWIAAADGTHRRRLGAGIAPLVSPDAGRSRPRCWE
jgi:hypothetical protein